MFPEFRPEFVKEFFLTHFVGRGIKNCPTYAASFVGEAAMKSLHEPQTWFDKLTMRESEDCRESRSAK